MSFNLLDNEWLGLFLALISCAGINFAVCFAYVPMQDFLSHRLSMPTNDRPLFERILHLFFFIWIIELSLTALQQFHYEYGDQSLAEALANNIFGATFVVWLFVISLTSILISLALAKGFVKGILFPILDWLFPKKPQARVNAILKHKNVDWENLESAGLRIVSALENNRPVDTKDMDTLLKIHNLGNAWSSRFLLTGFVLFVLFTVGMVISTYYPNSSFFEKTLAPIFLAICLSGFLYFFWQSTGGRDCYATRISELLKCRKCNHKIQGFRVGELIQHSQCPFCKIKIDEAI